MSRREERRTMNNQDPNTQPPPTPTGDGPQRLHGDTGREATPGQGSTHDVATSTAAPTAVLNVLRGKRRFHPLPLEKKKTSPPYHADDILTSASTRYVAPWFRERMREAYPALDDHPAYWRLA